MFNISGFRAIFKTLSAVTGDGARAAHLTIGAIE
jgi:hypothetical protein